MGQSESRTKTYPVCKGDKIRFDFLFQVCFVDPDKLVIKPKNCKKPTKEGVKILVDYIENGHFSKDFNRAVISGQRYTFKITDVEEIKIEKDRQTIRLTILATVIETHPTFGRPRKFDRMYHEKIPIDELAEQVFKNLKEKISDTGFPDPRRLPKKFKISVKIPKMIIIPIMLDNVTRACS